MKLNYDSITSLCPDARQVMVYGYGDTKYSEIAQTLRKDINSPFKRVFSHSLGKPQMNMSTNRTLEGSQIEQIQLEEFPSHLSPEAANRAQCKRECKAALSNLVFENYKRKKDGLPIIPVFFCLENSEITRTPTARGILDKSESSSALITHSELRRAYKLCHDMTIDSEVREAARETFIFIKVLIDATSDECSFSRIDAPWEMTNWSAEWDSRKMTSQYQDKEFPWRRELNLKTNMFKNNYKNNPPFGQGQAGGQGALTEAKAAPKYLEDLSIDDSTIAGFMGSIGESAIASEEVKDSSTLTNTSSGLFRAFFKMASGVRSMAQVL